MKKAISIWSFPDEYDVRKFIDLAQTAGFHGVELALSEKGDVSLNSRDDDLKALRQYANARNLEIHGLASNLSWQNSFADNDEDERQRALEITVRQIQAAKLLGASSIVFMPGPVHSDLFRSHKQPLRYDIVLERNHEALMKLKPVAEQYEIIIAIENVWNQVLLSPMEMRNLIDSVDSPYVGAYFDVGNIIPYGFPEHWITILGERIKKIHFKDFKRDSVKLAGFVDLLSGDVNWLAVMSAIKSIRYDGWITSEVPPYRHIPEQMAANASSKIDKILALV